MKKATDIEAYAALDFEASSLTPQSWPIEIGLSWLKNGDVQTWTSLIRPAARWSFSDWSTQSGAVHGIVFEDLLDAPTVSAVVGAGSHGYYAQADTRPCRRLKTITTYPLHSFPVWRSIWSTKTLKGIPPHIVQDRIARGSSGPGEKLSNTEICGAARCAIFHMKSASSSSKRANVVVGSSH